MGGERIKQFIVLSFVVSIVLVYATLNYIVEIDESTSEYNIYIRIDGMDESKYVMYLPLLVDIDHNKTSELNNDFEIVSGNVSYKIVKTIYGDALEVTGVGDFELSIRGNDNYGPAWFKLNNLTYSMIYSKWTLNKLNINIESDSAQEFELKLVSYFDYHYSSEYIIYESSLAGTIKGGGEYNGWRNVGIQYWLGIS